MFEIKVEKIKGFNTLKVSQDMFRRFLNNFLDSWEKDTRETIIPLKISKVKSKDYLRFDYMILGKKEWLHVVGSNIWY
ncbi:hypothetical protein [Clostridium intestinale]|uniref:Uncharacterized protein n=1 Tax=Clostridium intestinale DSM 6191 TaxID=1121320 RepID=A0A1M5U3S8_9CLOT|nr:hypothetical protein [Clostridium intestinale]SHH57343.1 hypothetical protein SAMN02745941_00392 [Clostridium intestinale DSM 6191]